MIRYYSQSTGCMYLEGIHTDIPADAVEISEERAYEVLINPAPGKIRSHDENGLPILIDPPAEVLEAAERSWRNQAIVDVQWMVTRHRDQIALEVATTFTNEAVEELLLYIQKLRDWPADPVFPAIEGRPVLPVWLQPAPPPAEPYPSLLV